jgi:hypothetical protein
MDSDMQEKKIKNHKIVGPGQLAQNTNKYYKACESL